MAAPYYAVDVPDDDPAGVVNRTAVEGIDATGATLGQVVTAVDDPDNPGRTIAAFGDLSDNPAIDPGTATGTPGTWSHTFVTEAGGTFVLGAHDDPAETLGTGKYRRTLLPGSYVRGQATVAVAGANTAYLDCRVSTDNGSSWISTLLGLKVPLRSGSDTHAVGFAVAVDPAFVGDVLLDAVVAGGDGVSVPEIRNFIIESTSVQPPSVTGEGGPVIPGVPSAVTYQWELTEGSGQTVANKKSGGVTADLILGDTTSADSHDPSWVASPRRLDFSGGPGGTDHNYAHYDSIPSLASGSAIFMYVDIVSIGSGTKYLCSVNNTGGALDHAIFVDSAAGAVTAQIIENTGGGTTRTASATTNLPNGSKAVVGFLHDGTNLKLYVNPADGLPQGTVACGAAKESATPRRFNVGSGGTPPSTAVGPNSHKGGDVYFFAGSDALALTPDLIAGLYQQFKSVYSALP